MVVALALQLNGIPAHTGRGAWSPAPDTRASVPARLPSACPTVSEAGRTALLRWNDSLGHVVRLASAGPEAFTALGCVRAALMLNGAIGQPGYDMQIGTSWGHGAALVLEQALQADPGDSRAARALTLVGLWAGGIPPPAKAVERNRVTDPEPLSPIANALFTAVIAGNHDPLVLRGCTSFLLDIGDFPSARECSSRALEYGSDSTWHLLRLAYIAFRVRDSLLGYAQFKEAVAAARDTAARSELAWQLDFRRLPGLPARFFGEPLDSAAQAAWLALANGAARTRWVERRLQQLSDRTGLAPAAILATHFSSVTYGLGSFLVCMTSVVSIGSSDGPLPCFPALNVDVHGLDVAAALYRLWSPTTGAATSIVSYAMPLSGLVSLEQADGAHVDLTLSVRQRTSTGAWRDTTLATDSPVPAGHLSGVLQGRLVLPSSPDVTEWHLVASQSENRRGIVTEQGLAPIGTGPLALSDIVLGAPDQQMAWTPPGDSVWLLPLGAADHDKPVAFFVQIRSDTARNAHFALAVFRVDHGVADATPALQIIDQITLSKGLNPTHRMLGASRLKAGSYEFRLTVTDAETGLSAERRTDLILR